MNNIDVSYYSPDNVFPFVVEHKAIFPCIDGTKSDDIDTWINLYSIKIPENIEMRYDCTRGIEFYGETITLSGVYLDKETRKLSLDLHSLETVIAQIPLRRINFINTAQKEKTEATDEE